MRAGTRQPGPTRWGARQMPAEDGMLRTALLWASQNRALARRLPHYRFARKAVTRFMPGENVEDALSACDVLKSQGFPTVITRLGENINEARESTDVRDHYIDVLQSRAALGSYPQISVKPTQLGLDVDEELCFKNLNAIVTEAERVGNMVWVDMEYSSYVDRTISLFNRVRERHTSIG